MVKVRETFEPSSKQDPIHGNPVADGWTGALMRKPLRIQKCDGPTDRWTYLQGVVACPRLKTFVCLSAWLFLKVPMHATLFIENHPFANCHWKKKSLYWKLLLRSFLLRAMLGRLKYRCWTVSLRPAHPIRSAKKSWRWPFSLSQNSFVFRFFFSS